MIKVLNFEFKSILKHNAYILSTIIIAILVFSVSFIPRLTNSSDNTTDVSKGHGLYRVGDHDFSHTFVYLSDSTIDKESLKALMNLSEGKFVSSESELQDKVITTGDQGFIIKNNRQVSVVVKDKNFRDDATEIYRSLMNRYNFDQALRKENIRPETIEQMTAGDIHVQEDVIGKDRSYHFVLAITYISLLYILVVYYGNIIANNIAREKLDRTIEILITATSPKSLIIGKILANELLALIQYTIFIAIGFTGIYINRLHYPKGIWNYFTQLFNLKFLIPFILFIILGFFIYICIFTLIGASIRRIEDIGFITFPIILFLGMILFILLRFMDHPNGIIMVILSYLPFTSVMAMPIRYTLTAVPLWQVGLSIGILVISTFLLIRVAVTLYKNATYVDYSFKLKKKLN